MVKLNKSNIYQKKGRILISFLSILAFLSGFVFIEPSPFELFVILFLPFLLLVLKYDVKIILFIIFS